MFNKGEIVFLKSDRNIKGAIVDIIAGQPENRYQVFTSAGMQVEPQPYPRAIICHNPNLDHPIRVFVYRKAKK